MTVADLQSVVDKDAEIGRLRAALKPFADRGKEVQPHVRDDLKLTLAWSCPTAGELRATAKAMNPE